MSIIANHILMVNAGCRIYQYMLPMMVSAWMTEPCKIIPSAIDALGEIIAVDESGARKRTKYTDKLLSRYI
jgi:hypothetical protein